MAKKKIPKLLTYIKKAPHQYNLFKKPGSGTIDLEAQKKAGIKIDPKFRRKGVINYINTPKGSTLHTPSKSTKKAIWIEGYKDVKDISLVRKGLDNIWDDVMKTYKPEDVEVWYGGYDVSDTDIEIEQWAIDRDIDTRIISPFEKDDKGKYLFSQKGTPIDIIREREFQLRRLEERGAKGGQEGRQLLNMFNVNDKGEIKYFYSDTSIWWNRYNELQVKYGKGNTAKVVTAYLDEVEDVKKGVTEQTASKPRTLSIKGKKVKVPSQLDQGQTRKTVIKPNPRSALAALEVLEQKNVYYRKDAEDYNQMLIDEGHYDPSGTPEAIAFNKEQATQELVEGTGYYKKPKVIKDLYSEYSKTRISNIRADVPEPITTFEEYRTNYIDVEDVKEGKEYIEDTSPDLVRQQPYNLKTQQYVDKGEGEFKSQKVIMGRGKDGKDIIETFHSKRIEKNRINKSSLSVPKGQEIVDFSRPKQSKSAPVSNIITDIVNTQVNELGYTGKNVFGDFFLSEAKKEEKALTYEGKQLTQEIDPEEGVHVDEAKKLQKEQNVLNKELTDIEKIQKKDLAIKSLSNFFSGEQREWRSKTMLTELAKITDVHAPNQVSVIGASFTRDVEKKADAIREAETTGKIKGDKKRFRTKTEIAKALPSEMKEINEELDKEFKKYPAERTTATGGEIREGIRKAKTSRKIIGKYGDEFIRGSIVRDGAVREVLPHHLDSSKNVTDHRPRARNRYVRVPYEGEEVVPHIKPGERGIISRAYVSEPSLYTPLQKRVKGELVPVEGISEKKIRAKGIVERVGTGKSEKIGRTGYTLPKNINKIIMRTPQTKTTVLPEGETITVTQSKRTGKWGTPREHRKEALKIIGRKGRTTLPSLFLMSDVIRVGAARKRAQEFTQKKDPSFFDTMKMMFPIMGKPKKKHGLNFGDL